MPKFRTLDVRLPGGGEADVQAAAIASRTASAKEEQGDAQLAINAALTERGQRRQFSLGERGLDIDERDRAEKNEIARESLQIVREGDLRKEEGIDRRQKIEIAHLEKQAEAVHDRWKKEFAVRKRGMTQEQQLNEIKLRTAQFQEQVNEATRAILPPEAMARIKVETIEKQRKLMDLKLEKIKAEIAASRIVLEKAKLEQTATSAHALLSGIKTDDPQGLARVYGRDVAASDEYSRAQKALIWEVMVNHLVDAKDKETFRIRTNYQQSRPGVELQARDTGSRRKAGRLDLGPPGLSPSEANAYLTNTGQINLQ